MAIREKKIEIKLQTKDLNFLDCKLLKVVIRFVMFEVD